MPRVVQYVTVPNYETCYVDYNSLLAEKKNNIKKKIENKKVEKKVDINTIHRAKGFHFYIETTLQSAFNDPHSNKPREYYVENEERKERAVLGDALKFGMVRDVDIPNEMYEFIHEYDKSLD